MIENACCFFGDRSISETEEFKIKLSETIEKLITDKQIDAFLFSGEGDFDKLCLQTVTALKEKYPQVRRIYVQAAFPVTEQQYIDYLMTMYDATYYTERGPDWMETVYVKRNREMIDYSQCCVFLYNEAYASITYESDARRALNDAVNMKKDIVLVHEHLSLPPQG